LALLRAAIGVAIVGTALALCALACGRGGGEASPDGAMQAEAGSGGEVGGDGDTGPDVDLGDDGLKSGNYRVLTFRNGVCLEVPLPTTQGVAACRVLLADVDGGCNAAGLSSATAADVAGINAIREAASGPPLSGVLCALAQVAAGQAQSGWCTYDEDAGWCYVIGSCVQDASCAQALCATLGFSSELLVYDQVWLACP
jgi:hypothetical protein